VKEPREILVRGPNWTGDVVMATPGFRALRAGFPAARITLHLRESQMPLVAGAPWFDAVLPVRSFAARGLAPLREGLALRAAHRFDLGLCLPDSFSSALLMRAAVRGEVIGYRRNARRLLLDRAIPLPAAPAGVRGGPWLPRELHVLGLVEAAGCAPRGTHVELFVTAEEEEEAARALAEAGVGADEPIAILAPGASFGPAKQWPAGHFAKAGDALAGRARIVLVGTPDERALVARVADAMREPAVDLAGRVGLGALKAVVRRARVAICNDAGLRHVAVAFGVPCVVLFGPTSVEKTALNLERVRVLVEDVPCRPCYLRECPIDHRCLVRIAPERAIEAALPAFGVPAAARGAA
jgi:heptosyltransferase II